MASLPWEHWEGVPMPLSGRLDDSSEARMFKRESARGKGNGRRKKQHQHPWPEGKRKQGSFGI